MKRLFILFALPFLFSFAFTPMSQTIDLDDGQKQAAFLIDNPEKTPMAIEISLRERIQKSDGTEDTPVTKRLSAFPPQLIVPAKEKRTVRIQWLGEKPTQELAFRVIAEQLPLEVEKQKKNSGIKMLLKYVAALYVNPGNTKSKLKVTQLKVGEALEVTVENQGTQHQSLSGPILTLQKGSKKVKLEKSALKGLAGENILAGSKRVFKIPKAEGVDSTFEGTLTVE